jgi:hypothetical protein
MPISLFPNNFFVRFLGLKDYFRFSFIATIRMKMLLILGGLFILIFICIIPLSRKIQEYNIQKNGKIVTVTITKIQNPFGTRTRSFIKFIYEDKLFEKRQGRAFEKGHKIGDKIKMKHTEGSDIFLFENEKIEEEFISSAILGVLGIVFIVMGIPRNKSRKGMPTF